MRPRSNLNCKELELEAAKQSIVLETGDWYFLSESPPKNCFRLGFSSIPTHMIDPGIELIGKIINNIT